MASSARVLTLTLLLAAVVPASVAAAAPRVAPHGLAVSGEAIVRFEPGTAPAERAAARDGAKVEFERTLELPQAQVVSFDGPVQAALARLERDDDVAYAQPNYRYEAQAPAPDDSFFNSLWGLGSDPGVGALAAWDRTRGAGEVIAIVDSGIDLTHPDLSGQLWQNPGETPGGGDGDDNGRVDDVHGYDFIDGDSDPDDYQFHGTHVAGTAAAEADNGIGVAGVAPEASLMAVRVLDGNGGGTSESVGNGIAYAAEEGADVINLSLAGPGGGPGDELLGDAVDTAAGHDVVVVAAAGNEGNDNDASPSTPCTLPGAHLICVAALNSGGALPAYSNYGATTVDIAAPGSNILSAKTDWGEPVVPVEGFEQPGLAGWTLWQSGSGFPWGASLDVRSAGTQSASASTADWPAAEGYSEIYRSSDLNLVGQRGCRLHFDLRYEVPSPSLFAAGAFAFGDGRIGEYKLFAGSSGVAFDAAEASISALDGRADARPFFGLESDGSGAEAGVYLDQLRVLCRDQTYDDKITDGAQYAEPGAGSYVPFSGTSMAAPHVAGIAALVRAVNPSASAAQVVQTIMASATPRPGLAGRVVSGGSANAAAAVGVPTTVPGPPTGVGTPVTPSPAPVQPGAVQPGAVLPGSGSSGTSPQSPARRVLDLRAAPGSIRLGRSGSFSYPFSVAPGQRGKVDIRTRARVRLAGGKRGRLTVASKSFRSPANGRITLRVRLSRAELAVLRLNGRLSLRVQVSAGGRRAERNLTLLPPR